MPVLLKNYSWEQNESFVNLEVSLPVGQIGSKAEIKVGRKMVNITLGGNFLFRILLFDEIDKNESKVLIKDRSLTFNLKKIESKTWETLKHPDSQNGKILTREFQSLLEEEKIDFESSEKTKREKARENKDSSVKEQISVEADKRKIREDFKENEKIKVSEQIKNEKIHNEIKSRQETEKLKLEKKSKEINFTDVKKVEPEKPAVKIRRSKLPPPRQRNKIKVKREK